MIKRLQYYKKQIKYIYANYFTKDSAVKLLKKIKAQFFNIMEFLNDFFMGAAKISIIIMMLFIIFKSFSAYYYQKPVLKNFQVPLEIERQGFSGNVVVLKIADQLNDIRRKLTTLAAKAKASEVSENVSAIEKLEVINIENVDIPMIKVALDTITFFLVEIFNIKQPVISGYITKTNCLSITIRMTGKQSETIISPKNKIEELFYLAGMYILKNIEPLRLGIDYYIREKKDELNALINYTYKYARTSKEKAICYTLEAFWFDLQRDYDKALEKVFLSILLNDNDPIAHHLCGDILDKLKRYDPAIDHYKIALKCSDYKMTELYTKWANILAKQNKLTEATNKYQEALSIDPRNGNIYRNWGLDLMDIFNQPEQAMEKFKKAAALSPKNPENYIYWGNALKRYNQHDLAIAKYKIALNFKPNKEATAGVYLSWADILIKQQQFDKAFEKFEEAAIYAPISEVYYSWANALKESGQFLKSFKKYEKAIEMNPNDIWTYIDYGNALIEFERYKDAILCFKQAITINSKFEWAYAFWGYALVKMNQSEQAIKKCEKAIELSPDFSFAYVYWGYALLIQKKYDQAIEMEKKSIKLQPNYYLPYTIWGEALLQKNKVSESILKFTKALSIDPKTPQNYYDLGIALFQLNKYSEALEKFHYVVNEFYKNQYTVLSNKMIQSIKQQ